MSNEHIKALKVKRANAKRSLTSYENFLKKFDNSKDFPTLEKRFHDIEKIREAFEIVQSELESTMEDSEELQNYRAEFEEQYYAAYGVATNLLQTQNASLNVTYLPVSETTSNVNDEHSQAQTSNENNSNNPGIPTATTSLQDEIARIGSNQISIGRSCLPEINLPTFSGSYDSWLSFCDLFNSLIHEDNSIAPIRKLFYLKGCLKGEAADVISSIELSAQNYQLAWDLLKERYDNRKMIREKYIQSLIDIPVISKEFTTRAFIDCVQKNIRALKTLGEPIDHWDSMLIVLLRNKFNNMLRDRWEEHSCNTPKPTLDQMIKFLTRRAQFESTQSAYNNTKNEQDKQKTNSRARPHTKQAFPVSINQERCHFCSGADHYISRCTKFLNITPNARYETVKKNGWCTNCLRNNHQASQCLSSKCRKCDQRHHTLLHFEKSENQSNKIKSINNQPIANHEPIPSSSLNLHALVSSEALLATALVDIINSQGKTKTCRVFLDAGSQANFITDSTAQFLNLPKLPVNISVNGVDDLCTTIKYATHAILKSRFNKFQKNLEFLIIPQISKAMPSAQIDIAHLEIPKNIALADPQFHKSSEVDALIGVPLFYKLLSVGQIQLKNQPDVVLQKTQLGWVVAGSLKSTFKKPNLSCHLALHMRNLNFDISRFWEMEEIPSNKILSPEERRCEEHYKNNTTRDATGRYIVRLPFNENKNKLGDSYSSALRRYHALERRLDKQNNIHNDYIAFLQEYRDLKHMSIFNDNSSESPGFYLPHHAVIKQDSLTTKTRVVFDGSAKTSTGISLNEALEVGPKLQDDLFIILLRYRSHKIVLTADIEKMYRQIIDHPEDSIYQKILFRSTTSESIKTYSLNTVTYGTACASHLAIRSLHQLADDEGHVYPGAAIVLKRDFYVDDLLTGAETRAKAEMLRDEINAITKKGGFNLRKWASNDPTLLLDYDSHPSDTHMSLNPETTIKTLGIHWNAKEDVIFYTVNISESKNITKRSILSQIAQLFDPLGLLGPIIVYAKILIQQLWKAGVSWDESIPLDIHNSWLTYREQLQLIESVKFTRCITLTDSINIQIHGFADASERAYGACLYLRSMDKQGSIKIKLICSKSRVAPVSPISLPRLELCGALLLSRLYHTVKNALPININNTFLWSDSTIALHWINTAPHSLQTFIANRVAEIQRLTGSCHWRHVSSLDNPADLISRGQLPFEFTQGKLWQNGPLWLKQDKANWPNTVLTPIEIPDLKRANNLSITCMKIETHGISLLDKYSSLEKLKRIIAYILRFINNTRSKDKFKNKQLELNELSQAQNVIIKMVQASSFSIEINQLKKGISAHGSNKLIPLNPFLDNNGILRVGGRLSHSQLPSEQQHPILLPPSHHITRLIIREEHMRLKHAGIQATLYSVRQTYWPLNSRNITRKIIHQCVTCFRAQPRQASHSMGQLPDYRVTPNRPFLHLGVDYCGPFHIKERRFRNRQKIKCYVAVYVCMSTKAVHLELISDLTTEAFIGSLKRLFSRRGKSTDIYSDNATNFVGASRMLNELYQLINSSDHQNLMQSYFHKEKIKWHFIPPKAPHFGGLWEAAVKSFKKHFIRTVGGTLLNYDQLETYIIEIEAILNSRPISPLSSDPNDLLPLTPGHFLIGESLTSFPQADLTNINSSRLSAWQHAQQMKQHFWQRWYKEYLHQIINRPTSDCESDNLKVGTLVLIMEDNLPPLQWSLGRIIKIHPGKDGIVRVVTVKTVSGQYTRCVKKLCPLPIEK